MMIHHAWTYVWARCVFHLKKAMMVTNPNHILLGARKTQRTHIYIYIYVYIYIHIMYMYIYIYMFFSFTDIVASSPILSPHYSFPVYSSQPTMVTPHDNCFNGFEPNHGFSTSIGWVTLGEPQNTPVGKLIQIKHHPTIGDIISNRYLVW